MARTQPPQPARPGLPVLVAAATQIDLDNRRRAKQQTSPPRPWQAEAWGYFDEVPEVKEAIWYRGNQMSKLRLYVAVENPNDPDGDPVAVTDEASGVPTSIAAAATAELARLRSSLGGQGEIIRELDMNLTVAGECYLVGWGEHTADEQQPDGTTLAVDYPEEWEIRSIDEVLNKEGRFSVKESENDTKGKPLDPERDTIIRVWLRHPRWSASADSAMRGLLGECQLLQSLHNEMLAISRSRMSAGMLLVPNELSPGPPDPTQGEEGDEATVDPFLADIEYAVVEPILNPGHAMAVAPSVMRGNSEYIEKVRHLTFARDTDSQIDARLEARIQRIARGLPLPVEKIMGHQQTTFANARQVDEDEFNDYLRPSAELDADALTYAFLQPQLAENPSVPPEWVERMFVWFDPSGLIAQPDIEANANDAFDRFAINWDTYRRAKGYGEEDAPDPLDILIAVGLRRGILTAELTKPLLELLGIDIDIEALPTGDGAIGDEQMQALAALLFAQDRKRRAHAVGNGNGHAPHPLALTAATRQPAGEQLAAIDRELLSRLLVAANDAMTRALERAGAVLRARAKGDYRSVIRNVSPLGIAPTLGPTVVAAIVTDEELLAGSWGHLARQWDAWVTQAQTAALDITAGLTGMDETQRASIEAQQQEDRDEAWVWMLAALTALAARRMFDPNPEAPPLGEHDVQLRVPAGLVRQGLARAGGAAGLAATDEGSFTPLVDAGTRPAGGVAQGERLRGVLRDGGVIPIAYRWVYGPALRTRPFQPHVALDGTEFRSFTADELINGTGFPPYGHYMPGDHPGCLCDFVAILREEPIAAATRLPSRHEGRS